jgi:xylulokinase
VRDRDAVVGSLEGVPVINGSGDGFMATLGSGCYSPDRVAVTLGTTASARQFVAEPVLKENLGTFCYRATRDSFLLGCAGNNGGNALDWARSLFGPLAPPSPSAPIFLPMLHGERSPDWNPRARASFHDLDAAATLETLGQAVAEGVIFNLAQYVEILEQTTGVSARQVVVSGNGFHESALAPLLASLVKAEVLQPPSFGVATIRGLAINAWSALGRDTTGMMESILASAQRVAGREELKIRERFARYKQLRARVSDL